MTMKLRAQSAMLLAMLMLFLTICPASATAPMTSAQKEEAYRAAIENLETYLESFGKSGVSLWGIEQEFSRLGGYEQSQPLMYYTNILRKLESDEYDYDLAIQLEVLDKNEKFKVYLNELRGSPIGSIDDLKNYIEGRKKEYQDDLSGALTDYGKCLNYFDAAERYKSLRSGRDKAQYDHALSLQKAGDHAGAYYAFARANSYQDSDQRRDAIISLLGYTPQSETDNPEPVNGLRASDITPTSVKLTWRTAKHATAYRISMRQEGAENWTTAECMQSSYIWSDLKPDTAYEFTVIAVCNRIEMDLVTIKLNTQASVSGPVETASAWGFAGPVAIAITLDGDGTIKTLVIGDDSFAETEGFGARALEPECAEAFIGLTPPLEADDVDVLTGATFTRNALIEAINEAAAKLTNADERMEEESAAEKMKEPSVEAVASDKLFEGTTIMATGLTGSFPVTVSFNEDGTVMSVKLGTSDSDMDDPFLAMVNTDAFLRQFTDKTTPVEGVDTVMGATISSRAVLDAVNELGAANAPAMEEGATIMATGLTGSFPVMVSFNEDGTVKSVKLGTSDSDMDTPFLAMVNTDAFLRQFTDKATPIKGVDTVTGATISSWAVLNAVNELSAANALATKEGTT